jgi:hypothetical protein
MDQLSNERAKGRDPEIRRNIAGLHTKAKNYGRCTEDIFRFLV